VEIDVGCGVPAEPSVGKEEEEEQKRRKTNTKTKNEMSVFDASKRELLPSSRPSLALFQAEKTECRSWKKRTYFCICTNLSSAASNPNLLVVSLSFLAVSA